MDLLKSEIAKKRDYLKESKLIGEKSYFKRSALRQKEEEEYIAKSKKHRENQGYYVGVASLNKVVKLLRERNQPIRLYGESDYDTFQRLKRLEILEPESKGLRNDLIAALDKVDDGDDEEFYTSGRGQLEGTSDDNQADTTDPASNGNASTVQLGRNRGKKECSINPTELDSMKADMARFVACREATATDDATTAVLAMFNGGSCSNVGGEIDEEFREQVIDHILRYLKFLLSKWNSALNLRSKDEKLSYQGKIASATYTQTVNYIKPLLNSLQDKCCRDDILGSLVKIIALMIDGNYLKANDAYLELAIGNAPWPLGVTNHGIHSRTAQEKIYAKNVAHVLNDETQRKYIQAIKRLMTQCQNFFPSDPSKCVNYMGRAV